MVIVGVGVGAVGAGVAVGVGVAGDFEQAPARATQAVNANTRFVRLFIGLIGIAMK
jgi:hypothetical protein